MATEIDQFQFSIDIVEATNSLMAMEEQLRRVGDKAKAYLYDRMKGLDGPAQSDYYIIEAVVQRLPEGVLPKSVENHFGTMAQVFDLKLEAQRHRSILSISTAGTDKRRLNIQFETDGDFKISDCSFWLSLHDKIPFNPQPLQEKYYARLILAATLFSMVFPALSPQKRQVHSHL